MADLGLPSRFRYGPPARSRSIYILQDRARFTYLILIGIQLKIVNLVSKILKSTTLKLSQWILNEKTV